MQTELERHPGTLLLRVKGDLRLWGKPDLGENMMKTFLSAVEDRPARFVLSLTGVHHLDTLGISSLVNLMLSCSKQQIELRLIMPAGIPGEALRRVRIFERWPEFPDEQAALQQGA